MNDPIKTAKRAGRASTPIAVEGAAGWAPGSPEPQSTIDRQAGTRGDLPKNWLSGFRSMPGFDKSGPSGSRYGKRK